ncbi:MAG: methyl-accepting chemotaxis protein, partial [Asticcacaulis sp.]
MSKIDTVRPVKGWANISNWPFTMKFMVPALVAGLLITVLAGGSALVLNQQGQAIDNINQKLLPQVAEMGKIEASIRSSNGDFFRVLTAEAAGVEQDGAAKAAEVIKSFKAIEAEVTTLQGKISDPRQKKVMETLAAEVKTYREAVEFATSVMEVDFPSV